VSNHGVAAAAGHAAALAAHTWPNMTTDLRERVYFTHDNGGRPFRVVVRPRVDGAATVEVEFNQLHVEAGNDARERRRARQQPGWAPPENAFRHREVGIQDDAAEGEGELRVWPPPRPAVDPNWPGALEAGLLADADGRGEGAAAAEAADLAADADRSPGLTEAAVTADSWKAPPDGPCVVLEADQVFVGRSRAGWPGVSSFSPEEDALYAGNTLLVRLTEARAPPLSYALIAGSTVMQLVFQEAVTAYYSPVGNNDVPYPVAVTAHDVIELLSFHRLPRAAFGPAPTVGDLIGGAPFYRRVMPVAQLFAPAPDSDDDE
jgi:hypothetical protein